jgi:hypothetical protein
LTALALFAFLYSIPATAQQYQIVRADYGAGNRRIDVTQRLREVVCSRQQFRMGNSTFGTDPAPDQRKSLRIYTRGPNGRDNVQEFIESSTIDSSLYVCQNGNWNAGGGETGQYTILHAEYGTERNHVDVTQRLRELASTDRTFRIGNSTFGTDPDPGQIKTLRIYVRDASGHPRMFEYRESSVIDGAQFVGWGGGNWGNERWNAGWNGDNYGETGQYTILHAEYGTERNHVDVTRRLRELASTDRTFRLDNSSFGVDPDPGQIKILRIYARDASGRPRMFEYREKSVIDGAQFAGWGSGNWGNERWSGGWNGDRDDRR